MECSVLVALLHATTQYVTPILAQTSQSSEVTAAPTRDPRTTVVGLLRSTPRCCTSSKSFDPAKTYFYVDRTVVTLIAAFCAFWLVVFMLWLLCRRCLWSCQRASHFLGDRKLVASFKQRICLAALMGLALASFSLGTIGAHRVLNTALRSAQQASRSLGDQLSVIESTASALEASASETVDTSSSLSCDDASWEEAIEASSQGVLAGASDVSEHTASTGDEADSWSRRAARSRRWLDHVLLISVALLLATLLPATVYGTVLSRRWAIWVAARFGFFACIVLSLCVAVEFGFGVEIADFCRRPDANFIALVTRRGDLDTAATELVVYYATCNGTNPLNDDIFVARSASVALNATLNRAYDHCGPAAVIEQLQSLTDQSLSYIDNLEDLVACPPINREYQKFVHNATCRRFLNGLYTLAVVHAFVLAALYLWLFLQSWVCETMLLEEEFWLLPNPEIFAVGSYHENNQNRNNTEPGNIRNPQRGGNTQVPAFRSSDSIPYGNPNFSGQRAGNQQNKEVRI